MAGMKELKDQMASMQSKHADLENWLSEEHKLRKSAERKIKSLQERLDYVNQERFGNRRQRIKSKAKTGDSDRNKEKDDYDGTDDTLRTDSVDHVPSQELKEPSKKERDLSNRPDGYKTMGIAGEAIEHPSDLTKVPGRLIERRMVWVFSFRTFLTEECFEIVHYAEPGKKLKWGYFPSEGHLEIVTNFEGTRATPEFLQAIAYEVYVKNVTFGLLHQWLIDMGMTISKNTLRNWLTKGKKYLDELVGVLKSIALEKDLIMPIRNVLVIDVKRSNLKLRRVIQTGTRRRMIMMEPMIRFARIRLVMSNHRRLKSLPGKAVICPIVLTVIKRREYPEK